MFQTLVSRVFQNTTGGLSQPILYPAGPAQNTSSGQGYLLHAISTGIQACPDQKYVLLGYSQGASLVLHASSRLGKKAVEAIKAIILIGNCPGDGISAYSQSASVDEDVNYQLPWLFLTCLYGDMMSMYKFRYMYDAVGSI